MKHAFSLTLMAILAIVVFSCKKKKETPDLKDALYYDETACSDKWNNEVQRGADFLPKLENWLETKTGVTIQRSPIMKMFKDKVQLCYACSCLTGNVIYIWVPSGSEQKFIDLGFKKQ